jgi:DNA polymerase-3 subunit epsilon
VQRGADPSTQFVTATPTGQILRVTMAPVRGAGAPYGISGFVLMQDNITRQFEDESRRRIGSARPWRSRSQCG